MKSHQVQDITTEKDARDRPAVYPLTATDTTARRVGRARQSASERTPFGAVLADAANGLLLSWLIKAKSEVGTPDWMSNQTHQSPALHPSANWMTNLPDSGAKAPLRTGAHSPSMPSKSFIVAGGAGETTGSGTGGGTGACVVCCALMRPSRYHVHASSTVANLWPEAPCMNETCPGRETDATIWNPGGSLDPTWAPNVANCPCWRGKVFCFTVSSRSTKFTVTLPSFVDDTTLATNHALRVLEKTSTSLCVIAMCGLDGVGTGVATIWGQWLPRCAILVVYVHGTSNTLIWRSVTHEQD